MRRFFFGLVYVGVMIVPKYGITPKQRTPIVSPKVLFNYDSKRDAGP